MSKASALAAVVEIQSSLCLVVAEVGRGSKPRVGEFEVLVEVVEAVQEVSQLSPEQGKNIAVAKLCDELDEEEAHLFKELVVATTQCRECLLGDSRQQLLRVHLTKIQFCKHCRVPDPNHSSSHHLGCGQYKITEI